MLYNQLSKEQQKAADVLINQEHGTISFPNAYSLTKSDFEMRFNEQPKKINFDIYYIIVGTTIYVDCSFDTLVERITGNGELDSTLFAAIVGGKKNFTLDLWIKPKWKGEFLPFPIYGVKK